MLHELSLVSAGFSMAKKAGKADSGWGRNLYKGIEAKEGMSHSRTCRAFWYAYNWMWDVCVDGNCEWVKGVAGGR